MREFWDTHKKPILIVTAVLVGLFVVFKARAHADGLPSKIGSPIGEVSASGTNWSGLYLGVGGGYQVSDTELSVPGGSLINGISGRGWAGDARLGYDWQFSGSPFVVGVFGGYSIGDVESDVFNGAATATLTQTWNVGGRLGFVLPTKTMLYGGAAWQRAEGKLGGALSGSATDDGIMYVAGIEQVIAANLTIGMEYSLSQYEFSAGSLSIDPDVHAVKARLNWRPFSK